MKGNNPQSPIFMYFKCKLSTAERALVIPVTLGSQFEWFEFFLFLYWSKIFEIKANFSDLSVTTEEFIYAILLVCTGLFARPLGGIIFGHMGDKFGRKTAYVRSVIWITLPSIILTVTPSFPTYADSSLIYLGIMRLLQGIPVGGELPGALCLLYEGAHHTRKQYICSYLFVGTQLGQIFGLILIIVLQACLTTEQLFAWGWRLSFSISSFIGIMGGILKQKLFRSLHETESFKNLKSEQKVEARPLKASFKNHKTRIFLVLLLSIFEVSGFYLIYYYIFEKNELLKLSSFYGVISYMLCLCITTITIPLVGSIGYRFKIETLFKISAIGAIFTSVPLFFSLEKECSSGLILSLIAIMILFFIIQFSFLPAFIAELFPPQVRFTCLGFSFNVTDGVIGGALPFFASWLVSVTHKESAFVILFPISAIIFLICLKLIKREKHAYGG